MITKGSFIGLPLFFIGPPTFSINRQNRQISQNLKSCLHYSLKDRHGSSIKAHLRYIWDPSPSLDVIKTSELMFRVYTDPSPCPRFLSRTSVSKLVATCSNFFGHGSLSSSKVVQCACSKPLFTWSLLWATKMAGASDDLGSEPRMLCKQNSVRDSDMDSDSVNCVNAPLARLPAIAPKQFSGQSNSISIRSMPDCRNNTQDLAPDAPETQSPPIIWKAPTMAMTATHGGGKANDWR